MSILKTSRLQLETSRLEMSRLKIGTSRLETWRLAGRNGLYLLPFHPENLHVSNLDISNLSISNLDSSNMDIVFVHAKCHSYLQPHIRQGPQAAACPSDHMVDEHGIVKRLYFRSVSFSKEWISMNSEKSNSSVGSHSPSMADVKIGNI